MLMPRTHRLPNKKDPAEGGAKVIISSRRSGGLLLPRKGLNDLRLQLLEFLAELLRRGGASLLHLLADAIDQLVSPLGRRCVRLISS
jgi:hypothetical protein